MASLLELADQEFVRIRKELSHYKEKVSKEIGCTPYDVPIDNPSLECYIHNSKVIKTIDSIICNYSADSSLGSTVSINYINRLIRDLTLFNIETIGHLDELITKYSERIKKFAKLFLRETRNRELSPGISIFYLCYVFMSDLTASICKNGEHR